MSLSDIKHEENNKKAEMKTKITQLSTIIIGLLFFSTILIAQEQTNASQPKHRGNGGKSVLTEAQKVIIKDIQKKRTEMKEAFKATLSKQQKEILSDPRLIKIDRIKAFRASLTDKQVNMIKERQQKVKEMKKQFRSTLSPQQKMILKKKVAMRNKNGKSHLRKTKTLRSIL